MMTLDSAASELHALVDAVAAELPGSPVTREDEDESSDPYWAPGPDGVSDTEERHSIIVHVDPEGADVAPIVRDRIRPMFADGWRAVEHPAGNDAVAVDFTRGDGTTLGITYERDGGGVVVISGQTGRFPK